LTTVSTYRTQAILGLLFVLINGLLFAFAHDSRPYPGGPLLSPTYHAAADGQRYWGVAVSLAETGSFTIPQLWDSRPEEPLQRSGPLPAIAFSIPIKFFGFDNAPIWIVTFQCLLVFVMGLLSRQIADIFDTNSTLLQALILFNPNLISLAHLAQSDILFSFIFFSILYLITKKILLYTRPRYFWFAIVGGLIGLLTLTRDIGLVVAISLPIILILVCTMDRHPNTPPVKIIIRGCLLGSVAFLMVVTPWVIRNHTVFQSWVLTTGNTGQLQYILETLHKQQYPDYPAKIVPQLTQLNIHRLLDEQNRSYCLLDSTNNPDCDTAIRNAHIGAILSYPPKLIFLSTIKASIKTMLGGGTKRVANYLGLIPPENQRGTQLSPTPTGLLSAVSFSLIREQYGSLLLFALAMGFVIATRLSGGLGLYVSIKSQSFLSIHYLYLLLTVVLFVAYFVVATSRFRAPVEPILMLYATIGLVSIARKLGIMESTH